jgi:flagellar basal-body rod protein FlgC
MVDILSGIKSTAAALDAERTRLDVIAENIANAHATHPGADGKLYQRKVVVFENALQQAMESGASAAGPHVARIQKDNRPSQMVYEPGHPDANKDGMVALPNVNIHEEMADLIAASRAFEANLAVVKNARNMALQTLAIGKK